MRSSSIHFTLVTLFATLLATSTAAGQEPVVVQAPAAKPVPAAGEVEPQIPPDRADFHLFLLVGQSNMAGRGKVEQQDREPHPRILMLNKERTWVPAVDPLHFDKPNIVGVGLGRTFALDYADQHPEATIGLIPCAVGGSPISAWEPGGYHEQTKTHPNSHFQLELLHEFGCSDFLSILFDHHGLCIDRVQSHFHSSFIFRSLLIDLGDHFVMSLINACDLETFQGISNFGLPFRPFVGSQSIFRLGDFSLLLSHEGLFHLNSLVIRC